MLNPGLKDTIVGTVTVNASGFTNPVAFVTNGSIVDNSNSTTTPLGSNGVFTGTWVNTLGYAQIQVLTKADKDGTISIQFSIDGTTVTHTHTYSLSANISKEIQINTHGKFYRVVYTNGSVAQTSFSLQSILDVIYSGGSVVEADEIITTADNAIVTKAILTGAKNDGTGYTNVKTTADGGLVINQNIQVDSTNSSTTNLAVGATFTGTSISNLNVTAIQVMLKTDQNCTVYIDQSPDGTNWDITDIYNFYASLADFAITVNAVGTHYRVRVTNVGTATTTYFRLQSILVPILSPLPRSLDADGSLQVSVQSQHDNHGFNQYNTPFGEQLAVPIYRLAGGLFYDSVLDTNFWTSSIGTGGTVAPTNGTLILSTGTTANNTTSIVSVRTARFTAGQPNKFRHIMQLPDTGTANNTRRWGVFTTTDGTFFELSGTTLRLVTRKASVDTQVNNGSFNGILGSTISLDTNSHVWEINYTPDKVYFFIDGTLIHTASFNISWSATLALPIRMENNNAGGSTTNVSMNVVVSVVLKQGIPQTQPIGKTQAGTTAGVTYKLGAGNLHGIVISNVTNNAVVSLYDATSVTGTPIWTTGAMSNQTIPLDIDFQNMPFFNGLSLAITGANCNTLVIYE